MSGRFKKVKGLNYKQGAIEYPSKLAPSDRHHLFTKPFYNLANKVARWSGEGLDDDTRRHFCDFANMAYTLALPAGAKLLDVGCGSGWLSEYFARLGYSVTGLDLSSELISIGQQRLAEVPFGLDDKTTLSCRFVVHDIEVAPLPEKFAAIICYDSLHHFEDEKAVVAHIAQMLEPGGLLFVAEGAQPEAGSQTEAELLAVMEQYHTLEAPFDRKYLIGLLESEGFSLVGDYTCVPGFIDRDNIAGASVRFMEPSAFNYLLCKKVGDKGSTIPTSKNPRNLRARLTLASPWQRSVTAGSEIELILGIENIGDTLWLVSTAPLEGRVRLGFKILNEAEDVTEEIHGWPRLQKAMAPDERVSVKILLKTPATAGIYTLKFDLLDQDICWFEQQGSEPLVLPLTVT